MAVPAGASRKRRRFIDEFAPCAHCRAEKRLLIHGETACCAENIIEELDTLRAQPRRPDNRAMELLLPVVLGAALAGFVQGLSGFGFGLTAMALWAWTLEPRLAAALA